MHTLQNLEIYRRAEKLSDEIWTDVSSWNDHFTRDTLEKQLVRAVISLEPSTLDQ